MDEFNRKLNQIDRGRILSFLQKAEKPCWESTLYKIAFPHSPMLNEETLTMFQHHFLLFHLLYRLQADLFETGRYLHVHFMRIHLADYPGDGYCRYYEEASGRFCGAPCLSSRTYCQFHLPHMGETELETLSSRYFYLDLENYYNVDIPLLEAFKNHTWNMLKHGKSLHKSYAVLDLPVTADRQMVKRKFRKLAKVYHPDMGPSSHERFNEINRAYRTIMDVVPV